MEAEVVLPCRGCQVTSGHLTQPQRDSCLVLLSSACAFTARSGTLKALLPLWKAGVLGTPDEYKGVICAFRCSLAFCGIMRTFPASVLIVLWKVKLRPHTLCPVGAAVCRAGVMGR